MRPSRTEPSGPEIIALRRMTRVECLPGHVAGHRRRARPHRLLLVAETLWDAGGLVSLVFFCFCPNLLAHAPLITPDLTLSCFCRADRLAVVDPGERIPASRQFVCTPAWPWG